MNDDNFCHWIAGFVDGEGCFGMYLVSQGHKYLTDFTIRLRADDYGILEKIRYRLDNIGALGIQTPNDLNPIAQWKVVNAKEQMKIVNFFEQYPLRAKKREDFKLWKLAVRERLKPVRHQDQQYLKQICAQMSNLKRYSEDDIVIHIPIKKSQLRLFK